MQGELNAEAAGAPSRKAIAILGVNLIGLEFGNAGITSGRSLPWLQDVTGQDVWTRWHVDALRPDHPEIIWRDVVVLGPNNRAVAVYNLTDFNLALPSNYQALKQILRDAASR